MMRLGIVAADINHAIGYHRRRENSIFGFETPLFRAGLPIKRIQKPIAPAERDEIAAKPGIGLRLYVLGLAAGPSY
jgi:hypothetical protein